MIFFMLPELEMDVEAMILESGRELGYDTMKEKQVEAATSFLNGNDTFVSHSLPDTVCMASP